MLGAPFEYINHGHTIHGKVSKSLSKKSFELKMGFCEAYFHKVRKLWRYASQSPIFDSKLF